MRILIIASSVGETAPGKVFSAYIEKILEKYNSSQIDIITNDRNSIFNSQYVELKKIDMRLKKLSIGFLSFDLFDFLAARRMVGGIREKYDVVISLISLHHFFPLYLGFLLKKYNKVSKLIVYSVDAIPPPKGWGQPYMYQKGLIRMIGRFFKLVDKVYFSNEVMLQYQLNILNGCFKGEFGVLYTLPDIEPLFLPKKEKDEFVLLYTGGIYQARKVDQLLLAVQKLVLKGLNIKLKFVGTNPNSVDLNVLSPEVRSHIEFFGYTHDLIPFYEDADLLIDIDADIENDVFISSKFFNYLMINRKILCITRNNSPVMQFVLSQNIKQIFFSINNSDKIFNKIYEIISERACEVDRGIDFNFIDHIQID